MNSRNGIRVRTPPSKPILVYDGACAFCGRWIRRWQRATGAAVDYLPFQHPDVARRFPELAQTDFVTAVHWIGSNGSVCCGAEAVFRSLLNRRAGRLLVAGYERFPWFASMCERVYRLVASHRTCSTAPTG